jgi:hypothetical protein
MGSRKHERRGPCRLGDRPADGCLIATSYDAGVDKPVPGDSVTNPKQIPKREFMWSAAEQKYVCPQGHRLELEEEGVAKPVHQLTQKPDGLQAGRGLVAWARLELARLAAQDPKSENGHFQRHWTGIAEGR